jgi:iron complex outermembrane receptor protein
MRFSRTTTTRTARSALVVAIALLVRATTVLAQTSAPPPRPPPDLAALDLEQLMQLEIVVAGSKRAQNTRAVPSFVSVVTAADIAQHGYRTLADVLKTLSSFYVTNDRNYSYVGVRGFERSGDYNSRVLLLLNGVRTNDNVSSQAYIGEDFIVDVDLIDRIEVIRGPSAAIYGSNAIFAVINVVTKSGAALDGGEVVANAASFNTYGGRLSYGKVLAGGVDLLASASYSDSRGQRLYYSEFDSPATNGGFANRSDGESFHKFLSTLTKGDFSLQLSRVVRDKGIPTAPYGSAFNDPRTTSQDGLSLASISYTTQFAKGSSLSARVNAGHWTNGADFSLDPALSVVTLANVGEWVGADVDATRALGARHFVTVGADVTDNFRQNMTVSDPTPGGASTDVRNQSQNFGLFGQDQIKLLDNLTLHAGARYDRYNTFGSAVSPRVALIYDIDSATTVKALFGRAFRAPNEYELHYDNTAVEGNPDLQPERIETLELTAQRLLGPGVLISANAFRNRLDRLITQEFDLSEQLLAFVNAGEIESKGAEFRIAVNRGHGVTGLLSYSLQRSEDRATRTSLQNSPRHLWKLNLAVPLLGRDLTAGLDAQYVSALGTLAGNESRPYTLTNVSLLAPRLGGRLALTATAYNLFDVRYSNPGSAAHVQDTIQQDGRSFRVKTALHF